MNRPTAYLISCSDHYEHRFRIVDQQLREMGYDTAYITSDFDHTTKRMFACAVSGCAQMHVRPYYRNLSLNRIISHWQFAKKVYSYLRNLNTEPKAIIALLPPNFLAHYLARYKKHHPDVKLIFDIFDLWPETFPSRSLGKALKPVFAVWAWLRNHSLPASDWVMAECDYFRQRLGLDEKQSSTIYLCLDQTDTKPEMVKLREDGLDLCYLGAINNVIGISEICDLLQKLTKVKPVTVHIIGTGERQEAFMESVRAAGAEVVYYGTVYDQAKKQEIMNRCHFGLNVIDDNACIGLTMKSVDYLRFGLPIISNVPADTASLIEEYQVGIQLDENCAEKVLNFSVDKNLQMREHVANLFAEKFSTNVVQGELRSILESVL